MPRLPLVGRPLFTASILPKDPARAWHLRRERGGSLSYARDGAEAAINPPRR